MVGLVFKDEVEWMLGIIEYAFFSKAVLNIICLNLVYNP